MLALGLFACVSGAAVLPAEQPSPPVETTGATLPAYTLASHADLRVAVSAPASAPYRATMLGTKPETVEIDVANVGAQPYDLSGARVSFRVRRGPVRIPCAARNDALVRAPRVLQPGQRAVLARDLCSLPLPGEYVVETFLDLAGDAAPEHVGTFSIEVRARGPNVPHPVAEEPGLFAAMGGNVGGVRFTRPEWASGAYHVVVRLTNASTVPLALEAGQVVFRVTRSGHPLACTATHDLAVPARLAPGESFAANVPVTCLIDVKGKYAIHASLAMGGAETPLGGLGVEVTSNPLLYLPVWPW
jgi:hypothetical protein